jgi:phage terminase large subunit-like protein
VQQPQIPLAELVKLGAVDNKLFTKSFFPKTARQEQADFHNDMWGHLEDPSKRFVNLVAFRDSAKTSLLRMFTGKRIGYNISRTILYVGASEAHAARSIRWIRSRIEAKRGAGGVQRQEFFASTFDLRPGVKWTDTEIEIFHGVETEPIWLLGAGITGNIRGINFDDYRPDLIVLDDILTDENGATKDQRDKITDLVFGSLKGSLAPASESPNAKLVMLNTPQSVDDVVHVAEKDPDFFSKRYPCWTPETLDLDVDYQISSWEARYPSPARRQEKRNAIAVQKGSVFAKEKEVRIRSRETSLFNGRWLQFYEGEIPGGQTVIFIDPTPPPKTKLDDKKVAKLDYEVVGVMTRYQGNFFLREYDALQGGKPDWTIKKFFEMRWKYRPYKAVVEAINYQATLQWILEEEMKKRQQWMTIEPFTSIKNKVTRITNVLHGPASNGKLFCKREHTAFIDQFSNFPNVQFDDVLDGVAIGVGGLTTAYSALIDGMESEIDNSGIPKLKPRRNCP